MFLPTKDILILSLIYFLITLFGYFPELKLDDEMKFMENFDPEKSKREQRKLNRKISNV